MAKKKKAQIIEYEIMICDTSHLILNMKQGDYYENSGANLIGCLVVDVENTPEPYPKTRAKQDEFFHSNYYHMLDASLCFSDEDIKTFLNKYDKKIKHTDDYFYLHCNTEGSLEHRYNGIKLLVQELAIFDCDNIAEEEPEYDTVNDMFNPVFYDPDDWEFVLKVKKIL